MWSLHDLLEGQRLSQGTYSGSSGRAEFLQCAMSFDLIAHIPPPNPLCILEHHKPDASSTVELKGHYPKSQDSDAAPGDAIGFSRRTYWGGRLSPSNRHLSRGLDVAKHAHASCLIVPIFEKVLS